jgi:hypothetical protein
MHHFLHDAPWDAEALNQRRLQQWQAHPYLSPHAGGVLIVDETGDPKRGHRIVLAAQQYLGELGHVANGVVAVTSHWADGSRQVPLGVKPYRPASRLPKGGKDPDFHTTPQLAWQLIEEARAAGIPFRLVVADSSDGEHADLEAKLFVAKIRYIMGLKPSHGTWQFVEDPGPPPAFPPAFPPAEAAQRLPLDAWERTVRFDSHGKELVRYMAELALGTTYGPTRGIRLIAATLDPQHLTPESTWYLATSFPVAQVGAEQVYEIYRLRDWMEHSYKPVNHELGWTADRMRPERALARHWQPVMLAYTFSLLVGAPPRSQAERAAGGKIGELHAGTSQRHRVRGAGRERRTGQSRGLESGATAGTGVVVPVGSAAALLETPVEQCPATRAGRAPRLRRSRSPA